MKERILLTGASSGIGMEMARILAEGGYDLIITARRKDRLDQLKAELEAKHGVDVRTLPSDLSSTENAQQLYQTIKDKGLEVTMLVNNAGFGTYGDFTATSLEDELKMIQVNISSLVVLSKLFSQEMRARNHGRIMNIASVVSFFPFPYYAVYAATKAFVLSFSEALRAELSDTNVTVTALCPGPTDTEFASTEMLASNAFKTMKGVDARKVAEQGVRSLLKGRGTKIVGLMNKITASTPRFSPRWLSLRINKYMASPAS